MELNFRYTHYNPYNEKMENVLVSNGFTELEDDEERIVYIQRVSDVDYYWDILKKYFKPHWTWLCKTDILGFEFLPASVYGWGFEKEVLVVPIDKNNDEMGEEFYIPIEKFIEIFSVDKTN